MQAHAQHRGTSGRSSEKTLVQLLPCNLKLVVRSYVFNTFDFAAQEQWNWLTVAEAIWNRDDDVIDEWGTCSADKGRLAQRSPTTLH